MDKELKQIEERINKINAVISRLDPAIKLAAFDLLKPFILEGFRTKSQEKNDDSHDNDYEQKNAEVSDKGDVRDFYASFDPQKPADSALVLLGWLYTQRGSESFSLSELEQLFDDVGVPRPARVDMTIRNCTRKGKKLFQKSGYGTYRPTVYGENHFKKEMNLKPGKLD